MLKLPELDIYLLYCIIGVISALVIGIILNRVRNTVYQEIVDNKLCRTLIFFIAFCSVDAVWGFIGSFRLSRIAFIVITYGFHTMAALASFMCSYYIVNYMSAKGRGKTILNAIRCTLIVIQLVLLYQNIFTDNLFFIDMDGVYHSTKTRYLTFYLQFCHYITMIVYSLLHLPEAKKNGTVYVYNSSILFSGVAFFFGLMQMWYPDGPFYSLGFMVNAVVIYTFTITAQRETYMASYYKAEEQKRSRKQIEEALERAEAASAAKTTFLSNMSHDIRTPINGIMGMVAIARKEEMSPRAAECLNKISGASNHLLSLVNDVLDMSRIESGKTTIAAEPMDVRVLADNCRSIILGQLDGRDVRFVCSSDGIKHANVLGDSLHLRQILINILGNAVKFTPNGGTITFDVHELSDSDEKAEIAFTVHDTGIGMKPEYLPHLFEAFSQEEGGARGNYKGTGLGMAITKQLVDLMGGTITVDSVPDQGTTFVVTIPFTVDHSVSVEQEQKTEELRVDGVKVLLVEDNELNQEIAASILEENGMVVTLANNGKEGFEAFRDNPPHTYDMILMDIMMPLMNGYEATRAIRALEREDAASVPIIAMTANAFEEDKKLAIQAGMNAHIAKPINFQLLLTEISRFIN